MSDFLNKNKNYVKTQLSMQIGINAAHNIKFDGNFFFVK
jgi:hypothetical protein